MRVILLVALLCAALSISVTSQPVGAALFPTSQSVAIGNHAKFVLVDNTAYLTHYVTLGAFATTPSLRLFGRNLGIGADALTIASLAYANSKYFPHFQGVMLGFPYASTPTVFVPNAPYLRGLRMYFVGITWHPLRTNKLHVSNVSTVIVS